MIEKAVKTSGSSFTQIAGMIQLQAGRPVAVKLTDLRPRAPAPSSRHPQVDKPGGVLCQPGHLTECPHRRDLSCYDYGVHVHRLSGILLLQQPAGEVLSAEDIEMRMSDTSEALAPAPVALTWTARTNTSSSGWRIS